MKKKLLYLLLLVAAFAQGQTLYFPDTAFNAVLLSANATNGIAYNSSGDAIAIDTNGDGLIQQDEADDVRELYVDNAAITNLAGVAGFTNLRVLSCTYNNITDIDLSDNTDLREVYCSNSNISYLVVNGLDHLEVLDCANNIITALDFTGLEYLETLNCADNDFAELDLSGCPMLTSLICNNNQITHINIKNGVGQSATYAQNMWGNNPLQYVCADDFEIPTIENLLALGSYNAVTVNTYCSFTPGGSYNTISGGLVFDNAGDGCDASDPGQSFVKLKLNDGIADCYTFTDNLGAYNFYTGAGTFIVQPDFENETFYAAVPTSGAVEFTNTYNNTFAEDFCVIANGVQNDVEVVMIPTTTAVPGGDASYKIVYKNKGNTTLSGTVSCAWDTNVIYNLVSIYPWPDTMVQNYYAWDYDNLKPFESREITMVFTLDDAVVSVGQEVPFVAQADLSGSDTDVIDQDNAFTYKQTMEAAYQDNFIACVEGETAPASAIGSYLHYAINFTNTGTEVANNVVITQAFDPAKFDISTLEILNSSHSMTARVQGNIAEFSMQGANVVDGNGHGGILIKIKTKPNLEGNSTVSGQSAIYFDFNAPVQTNTATTTFETLNTGSFERDNSVLLTPNPVMSTTAITSQSLIKQVTVYDVQGRQLEVHLVNGTLLNLDLTARASGIYFVKVVTEKGVSVQKVIRE